MKAIIVCLNLVFILSCQSKSTTAKSDPGTEAQGYLSQQQINAIINQSDFVDIIFYHMDISVSQSDLASVQQTALFLSSKPKPASMNCPSMGRLTLQSKGKIIQEADIHFAPKTCGYFTLIVDKKPVGTCLIADNGLKFLESIVASYQPPAK